MTCSVCGKEESLEAVVMLANVRLYAKRYCGSICMDQDMNVFSFNAKKAVQCFRRDATAHAIGNCPCGIVGS